MLRPQLGDMSRHFANMQRTTQVKSEMYRLSDELSSGKISDLPRALGFTRTRHSELVASLSMNTAFSQLSKEVSTLLSAQQGALTKVFDMGSSLTSDLISLPLQPSQHNIEQSARTAESAFVDSIAALRSGVAGKFVFSGTRSDTPPVPDGHTLLADLRATIDMTGSAAQIETEIQKFFTDPNGRFETVHYSGGPGAEEPLQVGPDTSVDTSTTALSPGIRDALTGFALAAIADELPAPSQTKARDLLHKARDTLQDSAALTSIAAKIGTTQHRVDDAQTRLSAQSSAMQIEVNSMEAADPFETAIRLQDTQLQLEKHFTSLARLSKLSLIYHMP